MGMLKARVSGAWVPVGLMGTDAMPRGRVASHINATSQAGFGTTPVNIGTTVTYTFDASRYIEIWASIPVSISATAVIANAAMSIAGIGMICQGNLQLPTNGTGGWIHLRWQGNVASGSKAVTIALSCNAGTVNHNAHSTLPSILSIVDLGI